MKFTDWIKKFEIIKQLHSIKRFLNDLELKKSTDVESNQQDNNDDQQNTNNTEYLRTIYLNIERKKPKSDDFTISEYSHKIILYGYIIV